MPASVLAPTDDRLTESHFVRPFRTISIDDVAQVGGKNASLGEMYHRLTPLGVPVPNGFAVTAEAYRYVLTEAGLWPLLHEALDTVDPRDVASLAERARRVHEAVAAAPIPAELTSEILTAYHELQTQYGPKTSVAVRSSATAEDLPAICPRFKAARSSSPRRPRRIGSPCSSGRRRSSPTAEGAPATPRSSPASSAFPPSWVSPPPRQL